jgi:chorismate mutase
MEKIRQRIDNIDKKIVELLCQRDKCAIQLAKIKSEKKIRIFQPLREREVLAKVREHANRYQMDEEYVAKLYNLIIDNSKRLQGEINEGKRRDS